MTRTLLALALAVAVSDCGGATTGTASVTGTVAGRPVLADNAIFNVITTTTGQTITSWLIDVTTYADACGCIAGANVQNVSLVLGTFGTTLPLGTYSFGPNAATNPTGTSAGAHYYLADPAMTNPCCSMLVDATSGTITISKLDASVIAGSFDIFFPSNDHLTGTFSASTCSVVAPSADAAACK